MARSEALTIALPAALRKQLDDAAAEDRVSRGEVIRRALEWEFTRRALATSRRAASRQAGDAA